MVYESPSVTGCEFEGTLFLEGPYFQRLVTDFDIEKSIEPFKREAEKCQKQCKPIINH
jgi:hypothetical protein